MVGEVAAGKAKAEGLLKTVRSKTRTQPIIRRKKILCEPGQQVFEVGMPGATEDGRKNSINVFA